MSKTQQRVFLVRAGGDGEDEQYAIEKGVAILGFREVPSLAGIDNYQGIFDLVKATYPNGKTRAIGNYSGQLWAFALAIQVGDIVVLPRKLTNQVALGRVTGNYKYEKVGDSCRHVRAVEWIRPEIPRSLFKQDLLYSIGAFMTVCNIKRNDAENRILAMLNGKSDPGFQGNVGPTGPIRVDEDDAEDVAHDLALAANDRIVAHIQSRFAGHKLAELVEAILKADGWITKLSPPGPDGGVDILGGRGPLGLDAPRLCVQVKSQTSPAEVTIYRTLQGAMQSFKAEQGLLVCWGGFNRVVLSESKQAHFTIRLWDSRDVVEAIYRTYERLPPEIQAELPLKKVWMLVDEQGGTELEEG
ncbi:MAG: restriction endonuclease [Planctomycetota bacterium]|jgi:restriction system protein